MGVSASPTENNSQDAVIDKDKVHLEFFPILLEWGIQMPWTVILKTPPSVPLQLYLHPARSHLLTMHREKRKSESEGRLKSGLLQTLLSLSVFLDIFCSFIEQKNVIQILHFLFCSDCHKIQNSIWFFVCAIYLLFISFLDLCVFSHFERLF